MIALLGSCGSFLLILLVWPSTPTGHAALLAYNAFVLASLLISARIFNRSSLASATLFAVVSVVSLLIYAVFGSFLLGTDFAPPIGDLVTALYYAMVTMSTVGYGDIVPKTPEAKLFAISVIMLGITVFATSLSALLMPLINRRMETLLAAKEKGIIRSNHYVIVSDSALARNAARELKARDQPVTFVLAHPPEPGMAEEDVVVGDASDLDVLRHAQTGDAKAILALGADDSDNAFVVMAAKELSDKVKTVAVVNDSRNMARVKRVHPDLIIAPQVLGGELLAMALSGEAMQSERLMQQLLYFDG
jgi:voltage-gated potassium channel